MLGEILERRDLDTGKARNLETRQGVGQAARRYAVRVEAAADGPGDRRAVRHDIAGHQALAGVLGAQGRGGIEGDQALLRLHHARRVQDDRLVDALIQERCARRQHVRLYSQAQTGGLAQDVG